MRRRSLTSALSPVRAELLAHYQALANRPPARPGERDWPNNWAQGYVDRLVAGEAVVLARWQLAHLDLPHVLRGVHGFYRVEGDGEVVPVVARRDSGNPRSIVGWEAA